MDSVPNKNFWLALGAIGVIATVYQVDSRLGLLLAAVVILAALGNMYSAGIIGPAKEGK